MHGGMLERDRSVGWRTGSTRVPLTEETTDEGQGSLRRSVIQDRQRIGTFRRTGALLAAMRRHLGMRKPRNNALLAILVLTAGGCSTVPDVDEKIAQATSTNSPRALILGADGTLNFAQAKRTLSNLAAEPAADTLLERHLAIEQAVAGTPLTSGNATKLLRDGEGTFAAVFEAIAQARDHINLEYYTLEDVEFSGRKLSALLIEKRRAGVAPSATAEPAVSLVDWLEGDGEALIERYERLYVPRNDPRWLRRNALVAAGNVGGPAERAAVAPYAEGGDEMLGEHARWALARIDERGGA